MRGVYFVGGGQFILHPFSHFEIQKNFACGALIFSVHIFRFKTDAGLKVDIDFNTECEFSFK